MKIVDNEPTILESLKAVDEPLIGTTDYVKWSTCQMCGCCTEAKWNYPFVDTCERIIMGNKQNYHDPISTMVLYLQYNFIIVGLNYLIEFVPDDENNDSSVIWVCVLCGSTLISDALVKEHFIGKRHRYRYLVNF